MKKGGRSELACRLRNEEAIKSGDVKNETGRKMNWFGQYMRREYMSDASAVEGTIGGNRGEGKKRNETSLIGNIKHEGS